jgi:hypothetical protein
LLVQPGRIDNVPAAEVNFERLEADKLLAGTRHVFVSYWHPKIDGKGLAPEVRESDRLSGKRRTALLWAEPAARVILRLSGMCGV